MQLDSRVVVRAIVPHSPDNLCKIESFEPLAHVRQFIARPHLGAKYDRAKTALVVLAALCLFWYDVRHLLSQTISSNRHLVHHVRRLLWRSEMSMANTMSPEWLTLVR